MQPERFVKQQTTILVTGQGKLLFAPLCIAALFFTCLVISENLVRNATEPAATIVAVQPAQQAVLVGLIVRGSVASQALGPALEVAAAVLVVVRGLPGRVGADFLQHF